MHALCLLQTPTWSLIKISIKKKHAKDKRNASRDALLLLFSPQLDCVNKRHASPVYVIKTPS